MTLVTLAIGLSLAPISPLSPTLPAQPDAAPPFVTAVRDAFGSVDGDRDGSISFDEYRNLAYAAFAEADGDGDLVLTSGEIGSDAGDRAVFVKLGRRGDQILTLGDYMRMQRLLFEFADLDGDGRVSEAEYLAVQIASRYGWVDRFEDHRLNPAEYVEVLARVFAELDADKTNTLSPAELATFDPSLAQSGEPTNGSQFIEHYLRLFPKRVY